MRKKITLLNISSNILLQIVTIISYFIIPKIILLHFGSETNGLVSSLNQFLNYITLIEGGVTSVIQANLYRPLVENDMDKINSIFNTASSFYKKIGLIYIVYSIFLAILYPLIFSINFSWIFVFFLTIILSINLLVQYMFSLSYKTLIISDKRGYIISISQSAIILLNIGLAYLSIMLYPSIHLLKLSTGLLYFIQPVLYSSYVKKHYKINKLIEKDNTLLKQRWNGFAINIAAFIHLSTDITILTIFTDLSTVSIYSIYTLVTYGLKQVISSISNAIVPTIGQAYASGNSKVLNLKMDIYEYIIYVLVFFLFSVAAMLITPFVLIYTKEINDVNYYHPLFGFLILISEAFYLIKFPHLNLSYVANKFKEITKPSFIEAIINIVISVILVKKYDLVGIALGTIIAMIYRMIFHVKFTTKLICDRSQFVFYKKFILFTFGMIIGIVLCNNFISSVEVSVINWLFHAIIYSIVFGCIYLIISIVFYRKELLYIIKYLKGGEFNE